AGEALGAAGAGKEAEARLRKAEARVVGRKPEVAGEREVEPAAERGAGDLGDRHLREGLQACVDALDVAYEADHACASIGAVEAAAHQGEVRAGAESALGETDQQDCDRRSRLDGGEHLIEAFEPMLVDRVHRRARKGGDGERSVNVQSDHRASMAARRGTPLIQIKAAARGASTIGAWSS